MTFFTLPTVTEDETRFGVAGDWHGDWQWAVRRMGDLRNNGLHTIFHLGDFGVWPGLGGLDFIDMINQTAHELDQYVYVTLGNHEDYVQVADIEPDENGLRWIADRIALFPRVAHFEIRGVRFLSLGGAPSIDFDTRSQFIDWWPEEAITEADLGKAIQGGHVEIMLTHDAPNNGSKAVQHIIDNNPYGFSDVGLKYAATGRFMMTEAVAAIKPDLLMHGHYHVYADDFLPWAEHEGYPGRVVSYNCNNREGNIGYFDLMSRYNGGKLPQSTPE